MKNLTLLILSVLLLSCSSDNSEDVSVEEGNFLDVYNGVVWKNYNDRLKVSYWYVFTPISISEAEYMDGQGDDCQINISKWGVQTLDGKLIIKENSKNLLIFDLGEVSDEGDNFTVTYTVTTSQNGDVLNFSMSDGGTDTFDRVTTKPCE